MVKLFTANLWKLHRIYKIISVLTTLLTFIILMEPLTHALFEGIAIADSYVNANVRVYEDASRAGYVRAEISFNSQINRYRLCFHIGDGWGYPFNPVLFILSFAFSTFIVPTTIISCCCYGLVQIYKWLIKKRKMCPSLPYIRALHKMAK